MDLRTIEYYSSHAQTIARRYESIVSPHANRFVSAFHASSRVLDIGFGSGRDLANLYALGFDVFGIDAVAEFVEMAQVLHPYKLRNRVSCDSLPDFEIPFGGEFDGVLCSAVLMHLDSTELFNAALNIKRCLKRNGRLLISVPSFRSELDHASEARPWAHVREIGFEPRTQEFNELLGAWIS
jgi:SAM-dependent methyltransferase